VYFERTKRCAFKDGPGTLLKIVSCVELVKF